MAKIVPHYNPECRVSFDVDETLVKMVDEKLVVHNKHVEALKLHWYRGHHVRVHSAGGGPWAKYVVKKLELEDFVHEIVAKDYWYVDDKPADEWMDRYYLAEEGFNGRPIRSDEEVTGDNQDGTSVSSVTYRGSSVVYPVPEIQGFGCTITSKTSEG